MNHIDMLSDKTGMLGNLFNVTEKEGKLYCGLAALRGGIPTLNLLWGDTTYHVQMPDEVINSATWSVFMSERDDLEFEIISVF
ncbi:MAG: hypothetical protein KME47_09380 [Nodosilinea sp. WJT8-NPBG4]|jgi:hypothetical protein|nr:hypothetical protein [Nodosilinea sp. WJT8-NPBG4]